MWLPEEKAEEEEYQQDDNDRAQYSESSPFLP
jgi:hypothetical protein